LLPPDLTLVSVPAAPPLQSGQTSLLGCAVLTSPLSVLGETSPPTVSEMETNYGTRFYRIEMLALLNDMIIVDRYLWE
jgi:hypothetical protein